MQSADLPYNRPSPAASIRHFHPAASNLCGSTQKGPDWNAPLLTFLTTAIRKVLGLRASTVQTEIYGPNNTRLEGPYLAPAWLTAPPASPDVPWQNGIPSLTTPVSQLCTSEQMEGDPFERYCHAAGAHISFHRKTWEHAYVWAALEHHGIIRPGARVLGFGVGLEATPAAFARCGMEVTATDAPAEIGEALGWADTHQHASALEQLHRDWLPREEFYRLVRYEAVDMNNIPQHLTGYDACWSACALEHLGSIDLGLDFIENSLEVLRPGGVAVHTTEFNLSSNDNTFDMNHLSLFRKKDIERLAERLVRAGHRVSPLNFHAGSAPVDQHIDLPPYGMPHLKLEVAGYVTTSFGMIVTKGGR